VNRGRSIWLGEMVQDKVCDGRRAYIRLLVRYTNGTSALTAIRYAANRCKPPATTYSALTWRASHPIAGFSVVVGETGKATSVGRYQDNPNT
jgi:hypothetical protein